MQHAWKFYQIIIYSLSIHYSDMFDVTWRSEWKSFPKQPCPIKQTVHVWDVTIQSRAVSAFQFYGCPMFIRKPKCSEDMANFLYDLSFLGPWIYGYATVSYNQILDHLKFWPTLTAITTALLKVKLVLGKGRWTGLCLKQLWIIGITWDW